MEVTSITQTITAQQALSGILDLTPSQGGVAQAPDIELTGPAGCGTVLLSGISSDNRIAFTFFPTGPNPVGSYDIQWEAPGTKTELADCPIVVSPNAEGLSVEPGFGTMAFDGVNTVAPPTPTPLNNQAQVSAPATGTAPGTAAPAATVPGGANGNSPTVAGGGTDNTTGIGAAGDGTTQPGVLAGNGVVAVTAGNTIVGAAGTAASGVTVAGGDTVPATGVGLPSQAPDTVAPAGGPTGADMTTSTVAGAASVAGGASTPGGAS